MNYQDARLPDGWEVKPLIEVADITMGQSPPGSTYNTTGVGLPFFQGKTEFGFDHPDVRKWCTAPTRIAKVGDILMSVRAPVGPTNVADQECAIGRGLAIIRARDGVPTSLVRHAIALQESEIASWGTGTTFTAISKQHFKDIMVVLPPLPIRTEFAALLDETVLLRRSAQFHVSRAKRGVERFRQAVLAAACSGRLTADWREQNSEPSSVIPALSELRLKRKERKQREQSVSLDLPELPETYVLISLGECALLLEYGSSKKCVTDSAIGVPVLRMGNIQDGQLDFSDLKYCSVDDEIMRLMLVPGDLLFNRTNSPELVGKSAVYRSDVPASFASYLIRVRFDTRVALPEFVNYWLNSVWGRAWAQLAKTDGVSQSNINGSKLALMPIPLPPIEEQSVIVERASRMLISSESLLVQIGAATRSVERSSLAVLAKAFRGELQ
jgi:type I restriction enzyme S subunit